MQNFTTKETAKDLFQPTSNRIEAGGNSSEIPRPFQNRVHTNRKLTIISIIKLFGKRPKRRHVILKEPNKKTPKVYGRDPRMLPRLYAARKREESRKREIPFQESSKKKPALMLGSGGNAKNSSRKTTPAIVFSSEEIKQTTNNMNQPLLSSASTINTKI
ncbi:hypothetical protein PIB30_058826 [Stylosanthes scabra]|uniref:Uncharacterized protein n=1 Tax=Stylosanthes scabra TaxID=79078 RepID=A0ABU6TM92_9FABA|nr:hypothetical protein [Stylosanthes scabra]